MRLLHPKTLEIAANRKDIPKTVISHAWSEVFKFVKSGQKHPKMFIEDEYHLGLYLKVVYYYGKLKGCNFDKEKIKGLPGEIQIGFNCSIDPEWATHILLRNYFNASYLFSDSCSLYFKGINIFPDICGDEWRKYVPVESHKEILRQITKTVNK